MEPDVRYCTTKDGVRIAYTVTGEGPVFVSMIDNLVSHVALEWSHPGVAPMLEEEARYFKLVRLDMRGTGLSERVAPTSWDEVLLDLEAVVDRLELDSFTLHGNTTSVPFVIAFASRNQERVSRLVLIDGYLSSSEFLGAPQIAAINAAAASDWETATEAIGALAFGSGSDQARTHGQYVRQCIGPDYFEWSAKLADVDVSQEAASLSMPVLVVRHLGFRWMTDQMTQDLVATIPDARLVTVNGTWGDDFETMTRRMADFVYEGSDIPFPVVGSTGPEPAQAPAGLRTILFTDLASSTALTQRLGDAKAQELVRAHNAIVREALAAQGGSEIKHTGDGIMASFPTASGALECAIAIQRAVEGSGVERRGSTDLAVHIGVNAGEPVAEESDLFGTSVQLARRICDHASSGQILVSNVVRELSAGKGFLFADIGEVVPKGFEEPVRLYEVRWRD